MSSPQGGHDDLTGTRVSDGAENTHPDLAAVYQAYVQRFGTTPTVYWYRTGQDTDYRSPTWIAQFERAMQEAGANMTTIDLRAGVDYYSLPNVVQTMRVGKYDQLQEIMATRLRTLDEVLTRTVGQGVYATR